MSDENSGRATPTAKAMCWHQWYGATSRVRVCVRVRGHAGYHKSLGGAFARSEPVPVLPVCPASASPGPRGKVGEVTVVDISGDGIGPWRLFIGEYGVADWPCTHDPNKYAHVVAESARSALRIWGRASASAQRECMCTKLYGRVGCPVHEQTGLDTACECGGTDGGHTDACQRRTSNASPGSFTVRQPDGEKALARWLTEANERAEKAEAKVHDLIARHGEPVDRALDAEAAPRTGSAQTCNCVARVRERATTRERAAMAIEPGAISDRSWVRGRGASAYNVEMHDARLLHDVAEMLSTPSAPTAEPTAERLERLGFEPVPHYQKDPFVRPMTAPNACVDSPDFVDPALKTLADRDFVRVGPSSCDDWERATRATNIFGLVDESARGALLFAVEREIRDVRRETIEASFIWLNAESGCHNDREAQCLVTAANEMRAALFTSPAPKEKKA